MIVLALSLGVAGCAGKTSPEPSESMRMPEAESSYNAGRYTEAEQILVGVLRREPDNVDAWRLYARVLGSQGKNEKAIAAYGEIVRLEPKDDVALYRMALMERLVGATSSSEQHLRAALSNSPESRTYLDELARTEMELGDYDEAATLWGRVLSDGSLSEEDRRSTLALQVQAFRAAKDYVSAQKALKASKASTSK